MGREEPVEDARVDDLGAGLGELGAHHHRDRAADEEEEEAGDDVLDPDHLVIGVELEVVAPAVRAVLGVVVGHGRGARGPAEPVVEAAEADQVAERRGDRGHDDVRIVGRVGLEDREAGDRAQGDHEPEAERAADQRAEKRAWLSGCPQSRCHFSPEPGPTPSPAVGRFYSPRYFVPAVLSVRYATSALSCCSSSESANVSGMIPAPKPFESSASGSTMDCSISAGVRWGRTSSRSGPTSAVEPGRGERVAAAAARLREDLLARGGLLRRAPRRRRRPLLPALRRPRPPPRPPDRRSTCRILLGLDDDGRAHRRVADAAQLGADQRVAALAVRGRRDVGRQPGNDVLLHPPLGDPEGVDDVERLHRELDLAIHRDVELGRGHAPARGTRSATRTAAR